MDKRLFLLVVLLAIALAPTSAAYGECYFGIKSVGESPSGNTLITLCQPYVAEVPNISWNITNIAFSEASDYNATVYLNTSFLWNGDFEWKSRNGMIDGWVVEQASTSTTYSYGGAQSAKIQPNDTSYLDYETFPLGNDLNNNYTLNFRCTTANLTSPKYINVTLYNTTHNITYAKLCDNSTWSSNFIWAASVPSHVWKVRFHNPASNGASIYVDDVWFGRYWNGATVNSDDTNTLLPFDICGDFELDHAYDRTKHPFNITAMTQDSLYNCSSNMTLNYLNIRVYGNGSQFTDPLMVWKVNDTNKMIVTPAGWGETNELLVLTGGEMALHCLDARNGCPTNTSYTSTFGPDFNGSFESSNVSLVFYDPTSYNYTSTVAFLPAYSSPMDVNLTQSGMMPIFEFQDLGMKTQGPPPTPDLGIISIWQGSTLLYKVNASPTGSDFKPPYPPLAVGSQHTIQINATNFPAKNLSIYVDKAGMGGFMVVDWNSTQIASWGGQYATVKGKVLNATGTPSIGAYVYLQPLYSNSPFINMIVSNITDANGMYSLRAPKNTLECFDCQEGPQPYKFKIHVIDSTRNTTTGAPKFYPTTYDADKRGVKIQADMVAVSDITLSAGGLAQVEVTLSAASEQQLFTELSQFSSNIFGVIRPVYSKAISMANAFGGLVDITAVTLKSVAPTGTSQIEIWGMSFGEQSSSVASVCKLDVNITQGQVTPTSCTLEAVGNLGINTVDCDESLLSTQQCSAGGQQGGDGPDQFWWQYNVIVTNASNGQRALFMDDKSDLPYMNGGMLPLLPGNYTITFVPKWDWDKPMEFTTFDTFPVTAGGDTTLNLSFFKGWQFRAKMPYRFVPNQNNVVDVAAFDFMNDSSAPLNGTKFGVVMQFMAVKADGTNATTWLPMSWNASTNSARLNFNATNYNMGAGKYNAIFKASLYGYNSTPARRVGNFSSTSSKGESPFVVSDFDLGIDLGKMSYGPSDTNVTGKLFAFNQQTPVSGSGTATIYDQDGNLVSSAVVSTSASGEGTLSITCPDDTSHYQLLVTLNGGASGQGMAENWFKVSSLVLNTEFNKERYAPTDNVTLKMTLTNGTTNAAVVNATLEVFLEGSQSSTFATTGTSGNATVTLSPSGSWTYGGHNVRIKASKDATTAIVKDEFYAWFEVRGFDIRFYPDKGRFATTDNIVLVAETQPGELLTNKGLTLYIDGNETQYTQTSLESGRKVKLQISAQSSGFHNAKLSISTGSGSMETYTGFFVAASNIFARTDKWMYSTSEQVNVTVTVLYANGTAMPSQSVSGKLYRLAGGARVANGTMSATTNSNGVAVLTGANLTNLKQSGEYMVEVTVSNQIEYTGFVVSGLSLPVTLDTTTPAPGAAVKITVTAANGLEVEGGIFSRNKEYRLPNGVFVTDHYEFNFTVPSDASGGRYMVDIRARNSTTGAFGSNSTYFDVQGYKVEVSTDRGMKPYIYGNTANVKVKVRDSGNNLVSAPVTVVVGQPGGTETAFGSGTISDTMTGTLSATVNQSDGLYYIRAYLTSNSEVDGSAPFMVASIPLTITLSGSGVYATGQQVNVSLSSTTGGLTPDQTYLRIFEPTQGEFFVNANYSATPAASFTTSGQGIYTINAMVQNSTKLGMGGMVFRVENVNSTSITYNASTINVSSMFTVNVVALTYWGANVSTAYLANLSIRNPQTQYAVYSDNNRNFLSNATVSFPGVVINQAGTYNVVVSISNGTYKGTAAGTLKVYPNSTSSNSSWLWTHKTTASSGPSDYDSSFNLGDTIYVMSGATNATAYLIPSTYNGTVKYEVPLSSSGSGYSYGNFTLTASHPDGKYLVRLDTPQATSVNTTILGVV